MNNLDNLSYIKNLDAGKTLASIHFLPDQCEAAWNEVKKIELPADYHNFSQILFCGMGGSAFGGRMIKSLYSAALKAPVDVVSDCRLPAYVDRHTLIIAASYSGNTEETIFCCQEALKLGAKIIGITSGGKIESLLRDAQKPVYVFSPELNPSKQPRLGQGYMQLGQIAILNALGILSVSETEVYSLVSLLKKNDKLLSEQVGQERNSAKQTALQLEDKIVGIIAAEFLTGAVHIIRNSLHETAKHFADYFILPEANHHLLEGLKYPEVIRKNLIFLLINSELYSEKIFKRLNLTREVIEKNSLKTREIKLQSSSKLHQVFELIQLGSFITFYLAILHSVDPAKIPWVDYFKKRLARLH